MTGAGSRCYYTPTMVSRVCVEARVTLKSLMLFGRRYVAHCLPLAPAPAELELDPPLSTSTSQAFDTFCCKYLEPPLLGSFISISRLCASSTPASVAVGFTLRIMRAWVARKGIDQLALRRCCTALAPTSGGGGIRTSLSSKPPRPDRKPALAAFAAADAPPLSGAFTYAGGGNSYASARVHMAWVPEARLPKALTEGLFVCIEEGTSKHATSHDDDIGDQTREGCAHHSSTRKILREEEDVNAHYAPHL